MYAWLVVKNNLAKPEELQPCIIPFKKFEEQPKFIMEDVKGGGILNFTTELLQDFEDHLKQKISEIIVGSEPFHSKRKTRINVNIALMRVFVMLKLGFKYLTI
jgi:hypothetical protein